MGLDARERRRARAATVAAAYANNPKVAAALLAGSVARGLADESSDIEVDVFWRVPPTDGERRAPWSTNGWRLVATDVDEHEWADSFDVAGIKVDTSQFLVETLDRWIDRVLQDGDTEPEYQVRITAIRDGEPLHGSALIEGWRSRTDVYPDVLRRAMVDQGLDVWPRARLDMLAARDDVLLLHSDLVDNVQRVLDALMGLNRRYAPHPFHKWLDWEASLLATSPADLPKRVRHLLTAPPTAAVDEVSALVEETFDLVDHELPDYDTAAKRAAYGQRRVLPE
jgi:uncharacterized protein DUF4037